jgi:outer membrane lipoprotein SlyB
VKGGVIGGAVGVIGGSDVDTGRAARNAAILGGIIGAIQRGKAQDEQRQKRERYNIELNACMAGR